MSRSRYTGAPGNINTSGFLTEAFFLLPFSLHSHSELIVANSEQNTQLIDRNDDEDHKDDDDDNYNDVHTRFGESQDVHATTTISAARPSIVQRFGPNKVFNYQRLGHGMELSTNSSSDKYFPGHLATPHR